MFKLIPFVLCSLVASIFSYSFASESKVPLSGIHLKTGESVKVNFSFKLVEIPDQCNVKVISLDEEDYITRSISKEKYLLSIILRKGMTYDLEISNTEIGVVRHKFKCSEIANELMQGIAIAGITSADGKLLGVESTFINQSQTAMNSPLLNRVSKGMANSFGSGSLQVVSKVQFFHSADEIREMISNENLRLHFNENASVYYLSSASADRSLAEEYILLVGEEEENISILSDTTAIAKNQPKAETAVSNNKAGDKGPNDHLYFTVQLGSFGKAYNNPESIFSTNSIISSIQDGTSHQYFSGTYSSYEEASSHKDELISSGKSGVFVTAFKGGVKISLEVAIKEVENKAELE